MAITTAWHGKTLDEHVALRDSAAKNGYRFLSLSIHGTSASPHYTAVMIKRPVVVAQRDWPRLTAAEFQKVFDEQAKLGFGPVLLCATGTAGDPRFAAVFQMQSPIALTRFGLRSGTDTDLESIQGMNQKARADNLILHALAIYGDAATPRYAAIWLPNTSKTIWNADGILDTADQYQARFNAQAAGWCRPAQVATTGSRYASLFVHNDIGPWVARHGMTADGYQTEFNTWTAKGYFPLSVQGGGSGADTRYTALFVKQEDPLPQMFTPVGPTANAAIDNVILNAMRDSPVFNASLAIVHGKKRRHPAGTGQAKKSAFLMARSMHTLPMRFTPTARSSSPPPCTVRWKRSTKAILMHWLPMNSLSGASRRCALTQACVFWGRALCRSRGLPLPCAAMIPSCRL